MNSERMREPLFAWMHENEDEGVATAGSLHEQASSLRLTITAHRAYEHRSSRWEIRGCSLREARIIVPTPMHICLADEYPPLLWFAQPTAELYVSNAPRDSAGLLRDRWLAPRETAGDWMAPGLFLNLGGGPLLARKSIGMGSLRRGPAS